MDFIFHIVNIFPYRIYVCLISKNQKSKIKFIVLGTSAKVKR